MKFRFSRTALLGLSMAAMTLAMQTSRAEESDQDPTQPLVRQATFTPFTDQSAATEGDPTPQAPSVASEAVGATPSPDSAPHAAQSPLIEAPEPALPAALEAIAPNPAPAAIAATPAEAKAEDLVGAMKQALEAYGREPMRSQAARR